jgi:hypothetical protein
MVSGVFFFRLHVVKHLQEFAIPLGILKNLTKVAQNVLQQFTIHTCQNSSLAKTSLRACTYPPRGLLREISLRAAAAPSPSSFPRAGRGGARFSCLRRHARPCTDTDTAGRTRPCTDTDTAFHVIDNLIIFR